MDCSLFLCNCPRKWIIFPVWKTNWLGFHSVKVKLIYFFLSSAQSCVCEHNCQHINNPKNLGFPVQLLSSAAFTVHTYCLDTAKKKKKKMAKNNLHDRFQWGHPSHFCGWTRCLAQKNNNHKNVTTGSTGLVKEVKLWFAHSPKVWSWNRFYHTLICPAQTVTASSFITNKNANGLLKMPLRKDK